MNSDELFKRLRDIPLGQVLSATGFRACREGKSIMWKDESHSVNTTGQKWFDHEAGTGGYGAIDLAMHLLGADISKTVSWLQRIDAGKHAIPEASASTSSVFASPPIPDETRWPSARRYLLQVRSLVPLHVDRLHASGDLYANEYGVVFIHRTIAGEAVGCSIRSSFHASSFRQCLGTKLQAWFSSEGREFPWHGPGLPVAVVESGIEALSYRALHRGTVSLSVSGSYIPDALLDVLGRQPRELILALNNDKAGAQGILSAIQRLEALGPELSAKVTTHIPRLKDWNAELTNHRHLGI